MKAGDIVKVKIPEGLYREGEHPYLETGKVYKATLVNEHAAEFHTEDNTYINILLKECAHLEGYDWDIVEHIEV